MRARLSTLVLLAFAAASGPALAESNASFMRQAISGDNSEIRLGRIAAQRAASPDVRAFGQMLDQDHANARRQALLVAQALGVRPSDDITPEARQEEQRLRRLDGTAFDREFVRYMVADHRHDIADFQHEARTGGAETRQFAEQSLPTLIKHLQTALELQRRSDQPPT